MDSTTVLLREILIEGISRNQTEIRQALQKKGIDCSQSKVSRLLNQIGAVKVIDEKGKTHYRLPHEAGLLHEITSVNENALMHQWVFNIDHNESLIVIHTTPAAAGMVARIIDQKRVDLDILGIIAGDDTIFITPKTLSRIRSIKKQITVLLKL
jgi:transcriptional regulator of arginine metabolism